MADENPHIDDNQQKINLDNKLSNIISKKAIGILKTIGLSLLIQQDKNSDYYLCMSGGMAWEELIDKNILLNNDNLSDNMQNIDTSNNLNCILIQRNKLKDMKGKNIKAKNSIYQFLTNIVENIPENTWKYMYGLLVTINQALSDIEIDTKKQNKQIDLSIYKPTIENWNDISSLFTDSFMVKEINSKFGRKIYYIILLYKDLDLQILEVDGEQIYYDEQYIKDNSILGIKDSEIVSCVETFMVLLSPQYISKTLKYLITEESKYPKKPKAIARSKILEMQMSKIDNKKEYKTLFENNPIDLTMYFGVDDNGIFKSNNAEDSGDIKLYIQYYNQLKDKDYSKILECYTQKGYENINNYLLQKEIFGDAAKLKNTDNEPCKKYTDNVNLVFDDMKKCFNMIKNIEGNLPSIPVYRFTRSLTYTTEIEKYKINDILTIPTFISTTYKINTTHTIYMVC